MMEKNYESNKQVFKSEKDATECLCEKKEAKCFDCGCEMNFKEEEVENGLLLAYEDSEEEIFVFKCNDCFSKNEGLEDYKECEVYSRIVGYLRPVNQWNDGKKQEYTERKEYKVL